jgi:hypothetical protein
MSYNFFKSILMQYISGIDFNVAKIKFSTYCAKMHSDFLQQCHSTGRPRLVSQTSVNQIFDLLVILFLQYFWFAAAAPHYALDSDCESLQSFVQV